MSITTTSVTVAPQGAATLATVPVTITGRSARQGEWIFVRFDDAGAEAEYAPVGAEEGAPLSYNERRAHVVVGDCSIARDDAGDVVVVVVGRGGAILRHDEHRWLVFPADTRWRVMRQRVADPVALAERPAVD